MYPASLGRVCGSSVSMVPYHSDEGSVHPDMVAVHTKRGLMGNYPIDKFGPDPLSSGGHVRSSAIFVFDRYMHGTQHGWA